jgi:hypothetical protein
MLMPFGKHKGCPVRDLPDSYVQWLVDGDILYGPLRDEVEAEYAYRFAAGARGTQARTAGLSIHIAPLHVSVVRDIIERGYKAAAKVYHPDAGGDHAAMLELNAAADSLRGQLTALEVAR